MSLSHLSNVFKVQVPSSITASAEEQAVSMITLGSVEVEEIRDAFRQRGVRTSHQLKSWSRDRVLEAL